MKWLVLTLGIVVCTGRMACAQAEFAYASKPVFTLNRADPRRENAPAKISIWCEFEPYESVRKYLPALAERKIDLFLHVGPNDLGNKDLLALLREAESQGVDVYAWLLLPYDKHLYVGEWTIESTRKLALDFAAWVKRDQLAVHWIVFDCEPAPEIGKNMYEQVRHASFRGLTSYLRQQKNGERFAQSVKELNALIGELHAQDFKVLGSCNRVILDGMRYGNTTWQDAFNIPFSMIQWDRVSFISYRYQASRRYYLAMVRRYSTLAVRYFGDRAGLDVGLIGDNRGIPENLKRMQIFGGGDHFMNYLDGIRSPREMAAVIATAREAGVRYVNLYALDGAFHSEASVTDWLDCAHTPVDMQIEVGPTPIGSTKAGLTGFLLNSLFRIFIREDHLAPTAAMDKP
jgi:hypothetical protein